MAGTSDVPAIFIDILIIIVKYKTLVQTFPYAIILCNYFTDFHKLIKFYDVYLKEWRIKPLYGATRFHWMNLDIEKVWCWLVNKADNRSLDKLIFAV